MASSWAIFTSSWIQPLMSKDFYFGNFQSTIRITSKVFLERGVEGGAKFTICPRNGFGDLTSDLS